MTKTAAAPRGNKKASTIVGAPTIIKKLSVSDVREFGGGAVGDINRTRASGDYAAEADIPSGAARGAVRSRMAKLTEDDVKAKMLQLFPDISPGEDACDCYIIVQELRVPRSMGGGFLMRSDETIDADQATTSFGMIVSIGPMAFKQDVTGEDFPGGASYKVGDIVRIPKFGGQEFLIDDIVFDYFKDRDVKGRITDYRKIVAIYF